jgi:hypothetical protein
MLLMGEDPFLMGSRAAGRESATLSIIIIWKETFVLSSPLFVNQDPVVLLSWRNVIGCASREILVMCWDNI